MSILTTRKFPEVIKQRLRLRTVANGRSMGAEARDILSTVLDAEHRPGSSWMGQLYSRTLQGGGVNLEIPLDTPDFTDLELKIISPWDS